MKKDRDSYFQQYGAYGYNNSPYMYPNMNNQNQFYGGYDNSNINERLNRIEKELATINNRLNKLEGTTSSTDYNFANSMYMV